MAEFNLKTFRQSPLAAELDDKESSLLMEKLTTRSLKDGEILIREGEVDNCLYGVYQGSVAITRDAGNDDWVILHVLKQGSLAGVLGFVDGSGHSATIRAVGKARVFMLERDALEGFIKQQPELVYKVMRAIVITVHGIIRSMNCQHLELRNYISHQHGRY